MSQTISEAIEINAGADAVWAVVGDPGRIGEWLPALSAATYAEGERVCSLGDGGEIRERILEHSDTERYYTYEIMASPLPLRSYRSRISVHGHGDHSHVRWEAELEALDGAPEEDLRAMLSSTYQDGLASLRQAVERG